MGMPWHRPHGAAIQPARLVHRCERAASFVDGASLDWTQVVEEKKVAVKPGPKGKEGPASKGMLDEGGVDFAALAGEDADAFAMPDDAFFDDFGDDGLFDLPDEE